MIQLQLFQQVADYADGLEKQYPDKIHINGSVFGLGYCHGAILFKGNVFSTYYGRHVTFCATGEQKDRACLLFQET